MFKISAAAAKKLGVPMNGRVQTTARQSSAAARRVRTADGGLAAKIAAPKPQERGLKRVQGTIEIVIAGRPMAKEAGRSGQGRFYKPRKTSGFERQVSDEAMLRMRGFRPIHGPVEVSILQHRRFPAALSGRQKALALSGGLLPDTKPDVDNMQKSLLDGLKSIVFEDDAQICSMSFRKVFGPVDQVIVRVTPMRAAGIRISRGI